MFLLYGTAWGWGPLGIVKPTTTSDRSCRVISLFFVSCRRRSSPLSFSLFLCCLSPSFVSLIECSFLFGTARSVRLAVIRFDDFHSTVGHKRERHDKKMHPVAPTQRERQRQRKREMAIDRLKTLRAIKDRSVNQSNPMACVSCSVMTFFKLPLAISPPLVFFFILVVFVYTQKIPRLPKRFIKTSPGGGSLDHLERPAPRTSFIATSSCAFFFSPARRSCKWEFLFASSGEDPFVSYFD